MILKAKNKLGIIFFPAFDWAISPNHPEREERLLYTMDQLTEEGIQDIEGIKFYNPKMAIAKDIERVHFCIPDVSHRVSQSHLISAGGAITAGEIVMNKEVQKSFAIVRPPGHHAQKVVWGDRGFCIINIEAIMAEHLRQKFGHKKIAIVDTDCHHGDGTQNIFWNDPDTLYISLHQDGRTLYPGTGFIDELGGPGAYGYNINIPLPPKTGDEGYLYVIDNLVLPILNEYQPDLIINSAGQDNHYSDPLTNMNISALGYAQLSEKLNADIAVLEGGYSIEGALPYVNLGLVLAMAGLDYSQVKEPDYSPEKLKQSPKITDYIKRLCEIIYQNWKNRNELSYKKFNHQEKITRKRQVYYDTDSINENQTEEIYVCNHCSGIRVIQSQTDHGFPIMAITIPKKACKLCRSHAYEIYQQNRFNFKHIYLRDCTHDLFLSKQ